MIRQLCTPFVLPATVVCLALTGLFATAVLSGASTPAPAVLTAQSRVVPSPLPTEVPVKVVRSVAPVAAMPVGNLTGWHQVMAEDFTGSALPEGWGVYEGRPGGNPYGWWDRSRVAVRDGRLRLSGGWDGGAYTTGGVMAWAARTTYGKYEVRFRVPRAAGASYALLLWPSRGTWPTAGEVDFAEDGGGARTSTTATLHGGPRHRMVQRSVRADFSRWQTVGVEWTPGRVRYTLNGRAWSSLAHADVPTGPMDLALQLEAGRGSRHAPAPTAATPAVALEVDWAVAYRRA